MNYAAASIFQLADPVISIGSIFFEKENEIKLSLAYDEATLKYTLDGADPSEHSIVYERPILVNNSGTLRAKAFHSTIQSSNTVEVKYFKIKKTPVKRVNLKRPPNEKYPGNGAEGLFDLQKGSNNFHEKKWMGFRGDDVELLVEFSETVSFEKIIISALSNPNAWIFPPSGTEIFISKDGKYFYKIAQNQLEPPTKELQTGSFFSTINLTREESRFLKIVIKNTTEIPAWHPGKGTPGWLFIDEILIE
ncbi:MAG: chitobiase/beta-hexosaminidase C-terminal domain-containing protein [Bacteroidota bacterium]